MSKPESSPAAIDVSESIEQTWSTARFRDCVVDRESREVRRGGAVESLEPRAFDLLIFLLTQRQRVVAKAEILRCCWGDESVSDGALARTVMKIRRAIGDADPDQPLIRTAQRVGYQFAGPVALSRARAEVPGAGRSAPPPPERSQRVALLPFENATRDEDLVWIELGLASVVAKGLSNIPGLSVLPVKDMLLALGELGTGAPRDERLQAVESALGVRQIVWGQLSGEHGRYLLHFGLRMPSGAVELGSLVGGDVVQLAVRAAQRIRQWLMPEMIAAVKGLDLGDEFLNEIFARTMQKVRVNRLVEAANLLDALQAAEVVHPELMYERAAIQVRLGRHNATAAIETLERTAGEHASPTLQARCHSLRALHLDQQGRTADAIEATRQAIALSDAGGLEDLAVHSIVECALRMGQNLDPKAEAMLSQALPRAERLGSRVLLSKAYWTAGRLAGMRDDWTGAIRHYERALAIARTMDEAAWAAPLTGLGWSQLQLGQLEQAHGYARAAFQSALISREQPQLGLSAICLLGTSWVTWRIRELVGLCQALQNLSDDQSAMMIVAREVNGRSTFLRMTGHYDRALACIARAQEQVHESVILRGVCDIERIRVLLRAGRFDEMREACEALKSRPPPWDRRLLPWIDRMIAFHDYFTPGREMRGLQSLHRIVRSTPACESHARISLDLSWLHLERHEVVPAERLLVPLSNWLEQSVTGILVRARLCYERGDWQQAAALQRGLMSRYAEGVTDVEKTLLDLYEATARDGIVRKIPVRRYPLNMYLGVSASLLPEVPASLGGLAADTTGN